MRGSLKPQKDQPKICNLECGVLQVILELHDETHVLNWKEA